MKEDKKGFYLFVKTLVLTFSALYLIMLGFIAAGYFLG